MLLSDKELLKLDIINPFVYQQTREVNGIKVISYGLGSYGYDIRLGNNFKIFRYPIKTKGMVVDPKNMLPELLEDCTADEHEAVIIPPNAFILGESKEHFTMPRDVTGLAVGKSTYARTGIVVNITPLESGWQGILTIEISNTTPLPAAVYAGEGIAQVLFFRGEPCLTSYADRKGKYQNQTGLTLAKL